MSTQSPIPANGLLAPGIYASFAGDSNTDYAQYLAPGNPGLSWNGTQLRYNNQPVQKVSYFIVEVGYQNRFFAKPTDALSYGTVKPWAALYLLAEAEVPTINTQQDVQKIHDDIQSHLSAARSLLNADSDFIQDERAGIATAVHDQIQGEYQARLVALGFQGGTLGTGGGGVLSFQDTAATGHANLLNELAKKNRPMTPTVTVPK